MKESVAGKRSCLLLTIAGVLAAAVLIWLMSGSAERSPSPITASETADDLEPGTAPPQ